MKECRSCNGFSLYEDTLQNCPVCDAVLSPYVPSHTQVADSADGNSATAAEQGIARSSVDLSFTRTENAHWHDREAAFHLDTPESEGNRFEQVTGNILYIRGRVTEIAPLTRYRNRWNKITHSLIRGEPYQFGHSTHSAIIRIEPIGTGDRFPEIARDVEFFGDIEGRLGIGDEVSVTARRRGKRIIARRIYQHTDDTDLHPPLQLPSGAIRLAAIAGGFVLFSLLAGLTSGRVVNSALRVLQGLSGWVWNGMIGLILVVIRLLTPFVAPILTIWFLWTLIRRMLGIR